MIQFMIIF